MITVLVAVRGIGGTIGANVSSNVEKLVASAPICTRFSEQIVLGERRAKVITVIESSGREVTSSSPVSGDIPDGLHTGHRQAVAIPFRCILVDWQIMQVERFALERSIVLQGVRLDQSPSGTRLRTKVAVDWERNVVLVHDVIDSICCYVFELHKVCTGSRKRQNLTLVS